MRDGQQHCHYREISFAGSLQRTPEHSFCESPSVAYESNHIHPPNAHTCPQQSYMGEGWEGRAYINERKKSIEVINKKIQNILNSIDMEEQRKDVYSDKYAIQVPKNSVYQATPTKSIQRRSRYSPEKREERWHMESSLSRQYSNLSSVKGETVYRTPLQDTNRCLSQHSHSIRTFSASRYSTKALGLSRGSNGQKENQLQVKGKNINEQINKLQMKIQRLEEKKKRLNIDSTPTSSKQSTMRLDNTLRSRTQNTQVVELPKSTIGEKTEKGASGVTQASTLNQLTFSTSALQQVFSQKSSVVAMSRLGESLKTSQADTHMQSVASMPVDNQEDVHVPKLLRKRKNKKKTPAKEASSAKKMQKSDSESKIIQEPVAILKEGKSELKRLLSCLQDQIKLDDEFRRTKKWFQRWYNHNKWAQLNQLFVSRGEEMSEKQQKDVFSITYEEENPFYAPKQDDFTIEQLVDHYHMSESHWSRKITGGFICSSLQQSGLMESSIDISGRGFISIQDLVRFVNYELDCFYRNRDIFLIYHRLKKGEHLHFQDIVQCLSH